MQYLPRMVYLWDQCESDSTTLARPVSLLALTRLTFYLLLHLDPSVGPNNDPSYDNLSRRLFAFIIAPLYLPIPSRGQNARPLSCGDEQESCISYRCNYRWGIPPLLEDGAQFM